MAARVTKYTQEVLREVITSWMASASRLFDHERTAEAALIPLAEEPNTQFYILPKSSFLILRNALAGNTAVVQIITPDGASFPDLEETKRVLSEAVKEYRLRRVSMVLPTTCEWRDYKLLGFQHEGRLRKAALVDNQYADIELLGALDHEIGKGHRRQRKRYRPKKEQVPMTREIVKTPPPEEASDESE